MIRALLLTACLVASPAMAQDAGVPSPMTLAWGDVAPHVDAARASVVAVALGVADDRPGPLAARRLWARRDAEARALAALHAWVDASTARTTFDSTTIAALHHAVDEHSEVSATRARVDGSACVEVVLALRHLSAITTGTRGLPWSA